MNRRNFGLGVLVLGGLAAIGVSRAPYWHEVANDLTNDPRFAAMVAVFHEKVGPMIAHVKKREEEPTVPAVEWDMNITVSICDIDRARYAMFANGCVVATNVTALENGYARSEFISILQHPDFTDRIHIMFASVRPALPS